MSIRISAIILLIKDVTQWLLNECQQFNYSTDILDWARQGHIRVGNVFQLSVLYEEFLLCLCLRLLDIVRILKLSTLYHYQNISTTYLDYISTMYLQYIYNISTICVWCGCCGVWSEQCWGGQSWWTVTNGQSGVSKHVMLPPLATHQQPIVR